VVLSEIHHLQVVLVVVVVLIKVVLGQQAHQGKVMQVVHLIQHLLIRQVAVEVLVLQVEMVLVLNQVLVVMALLHL